MPATPWSHIVRLGDLPGRKSTSFDLAPEPEVLRAIAAELDLIAIRKLRLKGERTPMGRTDWRLTAHLGATVTQPCIVTLAPVVTRLEEDVTRVFVAELPDLPAGTEVEMPEDDNIEPLTATIDLGAVMVEALALALPPYPREDGAELPETVITEPGAEPLTDEAARPFAGLKGLRDKLEKGKG